MVKGCAPKIAKMTLFVINFFLWVCSLAILGLGIWMAVQSSKFEALFSEDNIATVAYMMIGVGAGAFLIGFSGCRGAMKESPFWLNVYFFLMLALIAVEATSGILAFVYSAELEEYMLEGMNETIAETYGYTTSATESVDIIQENFDCCGATNYTDYRFSAYMKEMNISVPTSCCKSTTTCGLGEPGMPTSLTDVWAKGCVEASIETVETNVVALGAVLFAVLAVEIAAVLFSRCLASGIRRQNLVGGKSSKKTKKPKKSKPPKSQKKTESSKKNDSNQKNSNPAPPVEYMPPPTTPTALPATVAPYNPQDEAVVKMEHDAGPNPTRTETNMDVEQGVNPAYEF